METSVFKAVSFWQVVLYFLFFLNYALESRILPSFPLMTSWTLVGSIPVNLSDLFLEKFGLQIEAISLLEYTFPEIIKHEGLSLQVFYLSGLTQPAQTSSVKISL